MIQNNCKVIGITGGIGTGKSSVSNILIKKGYRVIDADEIARKVVEVGKDAYVKIVEEFGKEILLDDKTINRKALGKIIFNNSVAREKLNDITHPYIFKSIKSSLDEIYDYENIVFLDIPLLFEQFDLWGKYNILFDEILLVYIDEETQIKRLMKRNNMDRDEALKKIRSQLKMSKKRKRSSKIIDNSGDFKDLEKEIEKLLLEIS